MFFGSVETTRQVHEAKKWTPGVVINNNFDFEIWREVWRSKCLNYEAEIYTIKSYIDRQYLDNGSKFIRPCSDSKIFTGNVISLKEFKDFAFGLSLLSPRAVESRIAVSTPKNITEEWRTFIVDGKVSTGSNYMKNRLKDESPLTTKVIDFAASIAKIWTPAPVFTLDIGISEDKFYVVETGCFNHAGLYGSDVTKLVKDINTYYALGNPN